LWKDILVRVERLPGMHSASFSTVSVLDGNDRVLRVEVSGFSPASERDQDIRLNQVSPGFFQTFGIPLLEGRNFTDGDAETAPRVALFNKSAARFYFGDSNPIGAQVSFGRDRNGALLQYQVVGVVGDSRYNSVREPDTRLVYLPMVQSFEQLGRLTLAVRGD